MNAMELRTEGDARPCTGPNTVASQNSAPSAETDSRGNLDREPAGTSRIFVVEDHPFLRQAILLLIQRQKDMVCCGESDTVAGTPALISAARPDLVLLDIRLKDADSFEMVGTLTSQFPELRILVLSQHAEISCAERMLRAGAKGYVVKQDATEELMNAIRAVLQGKTYVSSEMAGRLVQRLILAGG